MASTFPASKADQERPYALLSMGGHALLLPQSEIRTLAPIQDISLGGRRASGVVGWFPFAGRRWPVFCLDEALQPRPHLPGDPAGWKEVAVSCFRHNGRPIPIVDVPYIFSDALVKPRR